MLKLSRPYSINIPDTSDVTGQQDALGDEMGEAFDLDTGLEIRF